MKKLFMAFCLMSQCYAWAQNECRILSRTADKVQFEVDGTLPAAPRFLTDAKDIREVYPNALNGSFLNEQIIFQRSDVFYTTFVSAFAEHRPMTLSPDMVWMTIARNVGFFLNADPQTEGMRSVLGNGQEKLEVVTKANLKSPKADWYPFMQQIQDQLESSIQARLVEKLTCDFESTGPSEKFASQFAVLDVFHEAYEYKGVYVACGIPSITLMGSASDWRRLRQKAAVLDEVGMGWWKEKLMPVLDELVLTAEGHPDQTFWRGIVMQNERPEEINSAISCKAKGYRKKATMFDGWFLTLFPYNKKGERNEMVEEPFDNEMLADRINVPIHYTEKQPFGIRINYNMALHTGFLGMEEDAVTRELKPLIGWFVSDADDDRKLEESLIQSDDVFDEMLDRVPTVDSRPIPATRVEGDTPTYIIRMNP